MSSTFDAHLSERGREALRLAEQIGREVAGPCSAAVDAEARTLQVVDPVTADILQALAPNGHDGSAA